MSKRQRRTPLEAFRFECYRTDKRFIIMIPLVLLLLGIFTRWVSGSPLATLHYINADDIVPPVWLLVLLFSLFYIVGGAALGMTLGNQCPQSGEKKYQGAMWFCLCCFLGYAWYPLFFLARLFLVSLIACALCVFCGICASACFASVSKIAFALGLAYNCWLIYLLLLNLQLFFAI